MRTEWAGDSSACGFRMTYVLLLLSPCHTERKRSIAYAQSGKHEQGVRAILQPCGFRMTYVLLLLSTCHTERKRSIAYAQSGKCEQGGRAILQPAASG